MKYIDAMHMYTARKIARKTSVKTLNLKGEMYFATETRLVSVAEPAVFLVLEACDFRNKTAVN